MNCDFILEMVLLLCRDSNELLYLITLAKPHPPSGEIAISELGQDSATLHWNPPIDDQVPVEEYVIEMKGRL